MKLYVAMYEYFWEYSKILGIYDSLEKAQKNHKVYETEEEQVYIEEYELNKEEKLYRENLRTY